MAGRYTPERKKALYSKLIARLFSWHNCFFYNPKASLFYMGILPEFFDLRSLTLIDIGVILLIFAVIPMGGNIALAILV